MGLSVVVTTTTTATVTVPGSRQTKRAAICIAFSCERLIAGHRQKLVCITGLCVVQREKFYLFFHILYTLSYEDR